MPQIWKIIICHKVWQVLQKKIKQKFQELGKGESTSYLGIWERFMEHKASESLSVFERLMKEGKDSEAKACNGIGRRVHAQVKVVQLGH